MRDALVRAGAEVGLASPSGRRGILAVSGQLYVELADGRRLHGKGRFGASYGDFFGDRRVTREEVERTVLRRVGKERLSPRRLGWEQLRRVLADEGLVPSDEELMRLPFEIEFSDELVPALDGREPHLPR